VPSECFELLSPKDVIGGTSETRGGDEKAGEEKEEKETAAEEERGEKYAIKPEVLALYRQMLRDPKYEGLRRIYVLNPFRREWAVLTTRHAVPVNRLERREQEKAERKRKREQRARGEIEEVFEEEEAAMDETDREHNNVGAKEESELTHESTATVSHTTESTTDVISTTHVKHENGADVFPPLQWHSSTVLPMADVPYADIDLSRLFDAETHVTREDVKNAPVSWTARDRQEMETEERYLDAHLQDSFVGSYSGSTSLPSRQSAVHMGQLRMLIEREYARGFGRGLFSAALSLALLFVIFLCARASPPEGTVMHWLQREYLSGSWSLSFLLAGLLLFAFSPLFFTSRLTTATTEYPEPGEEERLRQSEQASVEGERVERNVIEEQPTSSTSTTTTTTTTTPTTSTSAASLLQSHGAGFHTGILSQLIERETKRGFWRGVFASVLCAVVVALLFWCYGLFAIMHNMA
jgi:hypothetical protein